MNKKLLIGLGTFLAVVVFAIGLIARPKTAPVALPTEKAPAVEGDSIATPTDSQATTVREIQVTGSEFEFTPSTINVKNGEKIKLTFTNTGSVPHDLAIDELNVQTRMVKAGESDTVEFDVTGDQTVTFYCTIGNHQEQGMEGKLEVTL